ncbi:cell division protein FtsQ/DivIB [Bacillus shivajii]|uniref:cell division protein FtsQ/DivIB n=1 Tax=Bacillus shivajii TaxID=1983719 RepID=UPI001CF9611F|nr:cell division protein FtsQ/DivIB [Bacillus shivajii]UCZ51823.1 cell division protein FtsQ/DivIB [Bacillus shivajii]
MNDKKVVEIEERIPTLKERRKQRANRRLILYVSTFFLLMTVVIYFQTSISNVQHVEVKGTVYSEEDWVIEASELLNNVNMWRIDSDAVKNRIESNPLISGSSVQRQFPNSVTVHIEEYNVVAYIYGDENYLPLIETGERIPKEFIRSSTPYDAPILKGFEDEDLIVTMADELNKVKNHLRYHMSEIYMTPTENDGSRIMIYMNDGFVVSSTVRDFAERVAPYPSVVEQLDPDEEGIVHMRMNPYFERFNPEEDEEIESEG